MKKYETYKDSGLEWLGMVPEHWKVMPIKYVLEQSNEGIKIGPFGSTLTGKVSTEHPVRVYGQWNIVGKDFNASKNFVTEETYHELSSYQISANDILISMMGTVGKCAIIPETADKGIMDSHIVKVRLDNNKILPKYFYYIYDKDCSKVIIEQIQCNKRGSIMDGLNSSLIKNFVIALPHLSEQRAIVSYLDHKVGKIDALISEKEKMVEDLKAYRSSLITETVTKGLNKGVEMKDSGLEWLGMVPEHWKVMPIKYVLEQSNEGIKIGPFGSTLTGKVSTEHPVRVYGQWNIVGKDFNASKNFVTEETYHELSSYQISANDILISMMGTVGKCAIIPETADKGIMDSHIVKIRLDKNKVLPEYFYYIYDKDCSKVIIEQIQCNKRGSIMDGLNSSLIKNFVITLPPLSEQRTIASYLGQKVGQIDTSISELEHQLSDLKFYKSSLVTEAVTGKIDLRDWQKKNHKALWQEHRTKHIWKSTS